MGLFDFFKRKNIDKVKTPVIGKTAQGVFQLNVTDFTATTNKSVVVESVKTAPGFEKEFAHLIIDQPAKAGDAIGLKPLNVKVELWDQSVEITFEPGKIKNKLAAFVEYINLQLDWISENKNLFDEIIIRDLLKLKNTTWLEDDQPAVNGMDLIHSVRLTSIQFFADAGIELFYDDGDSFFGHTIVVDVSANKEIKQAKIAG